MRDDKNKQQDSQDQRDTERRTENIRQQESLDAQKRLLQEQLSEEKKQRVEKERPLHLTNMIKLYSGVCLQIENISDSKTIAPKVIIITTDEILVFKLDFIDPGQTVTLLPQSLYGPLNEDLFNDDAHIGFYFHTAVRERIRIGFDIKNKVAIYNDEYKKIGNSANYNARDDANKFQLHEYDLDNFKPSPKTSIWERHDSVNSIENGYKNNNLDDFDKENMIKMAARYYSDNEIKYRQLFYSFQIDGIDAMEIFDNEIEAEHSYDLNTVDPNAPKANDEFFNILFKTLSKQLQNELK